MSDSDSNRIVKNAWGDMSDRSDIGDNFVHLMPLSPLSPYRIGDRSDSFSLGVFAKRWTLFHNQEAGDIGDGDGDSDMSDLR